MSGQVSRGSAGEYQADERAGDSQGHTAGDNYIRDASRIICELYKHSPVYRIGGDEFAVYLQDSDYERRDEIMDELNLLVSENAKNGSVIIAAGMADYQPGDQQLHDVFDRADQRMYERKKQLKQA